MGQRINIQYSIDMDELPSEVQRLLSSAAAKVQALNHDWATTTNVLSLDTAQNIDEFRQALAVIDFKLKDAATIINSYIAYQSSVAFQESAIESGAVGETNEVTAEG
tara:strand:+ start:352 stop:672 length:321 start_codon:yes stop_codon:yes gene_type:complete